MITKEFRVAVATVLGLGLAFLSFKILKPFVLAMAWALVLAVVLAPVRRAVARRVKSPVGASLLVTLGAFLLLVIPLAFILVQLAQEIATAYPQLLEQVRAFQKGEMQGVAEIQGWVRKGVDLLDRVGVQPAAITAFIADKISGFVTGLFQNTFRFFSLVVFTLLFLFAFLQYGSALKELLRPLIPFGPEGRRFLEARMEGFIVALFNGVFLTALIQAVVGGIGYALFGLPSALFLATLTFFFALIPMGGATLVWAPLALLLFAQGRTTAGILLLIYGAVLISGLDNVIRPLLVAGKSNVNVVFILVGVLGGVAGLGMVGLLYGPIILYLAASVLQFLREGPAAAAP
jgi:predicted PurR-regulated permease PerM